MEILIGFVLGFLFCKFVPIFSSQEDKIINAAEDFRKSIGEKLDSLLLGPKISEREKTEWVEIAKFSDQIYFRICPEMEFAEHLEDTAQHLLKKT